MAAFQIWRRCLKAAKTAKAANVFVTVVTEMTTLTRSMRATLAPVLGCWKMAKAANERKAVNEGTAAKTANGRNTRLPGAGLKADKTAKC